VSKRPTPGRLDREQGHRARRRVGIRESQGRGQRGSEARGGPVGSLWFKRLVAARLQTATIPIVFLSVGDPIAMGLADNLAHPGHNATGFSDILADLSGKLVDIARELNGPRDTIDYVWHTAWPDAKNRYNATERAASAGYLKLRSRGIVDIAELDGTLAAVKQAGSRFVIVQPSPFTYTQRDRIIGSAFKNDLGTIFGFPAAAREGSLVAYGPDYLHMYRRAPLYVERVLKGT